MENKINKKTNEILKILKGLTLKEFKTVIRHLDEQVANTIKL